MFNSKINREIFDQLSYQYAQF